MNVEKIIEKLKEEYPGKRIVVNNDSNPTEIICEIDSTPDFSLAIAVIDESIPHFHNNLTETYEVIKGELDLFINGKIHKLKEGEEYIIKPGTIHFAKGNETWIRVTSNPRWNPNDHLFA